MKRGSVLREKRKPLVDRQTPELTVEQFEPRIKDQRRRKRISSSGWFVNRKPVLGSDIDEDYPEKRMRLERQEEEQKLNQEQENQTQKTSEVEQSQQSSAIKEGEQGFTQQNTIPVLQLTKMQHNPSSAKNESSVSQKKKRVFLDD